MKKLKIILILPIFFGMILSCSSDDNGNVNNPPPEILSSDKQIINFQFLLSENPITLNVVAEIEEETGNIFAILPGNSLKTGLIPHINASTSATISPEGTQNFSNLVTYTVTAEDGSTKIYEVIVVNERDALEAIHEVNPGNSLDWDLGDPDLSNWEGVTLNNGTVIDLLIHNSLLTTIPAEIGYFKNLTYLGLHMNDYSSLPPEIGQLTNLTRLSVGLNDALSSVPPEIGNLENLQVFHLHNNPMLNSLPEEIGLLTSLTNLYINGNGFSTIPKEICDLETNYGTEIFKDADATCEE